jgi:hypothetical protein
MDATVDTIGDVHDAVERSIGSQYPHERLAVDFAGGKHGQVVRGNQTNDRGNFERRQVAASVGNDGLD